MRYDETEDKFLFEGIKKLDDEVAAMVGRKTNCEIPEKSVQTACSWLQLDIEQVLKLADDFNTTKNMIIDKIVKSEVCDFVTQEKILDRAEKTAVIRRDFDAALAAVDKGRELSSPLNYGFFPSDITALAKLQKAGKHRQKIENLLEDCNFHTEVSYLSVGDYSRWSV